MSFELMICCTLALFTSDASPRTERSYALADIEQMIEAHQRMVRMCGPLSAIRACVLTGREVDADATIAAFRCRHRQSGQRSQGTSVGEVVALCRDLGLDARGIRFNTPSLFRLPTPCILLLNEDRHCVVLESTARDGAVRVWDPADLSSKDVDVRALSTLCSGHAIVFARMPSTQQLIVTANVGAFAMTIALLAWSRRAVGRQE